ncbi:DUF4148 domain-containing protein [Hydrogenophaga sp.]|uniref:DUF4148 domain-containing protein n=1 Tax=Hydrogenophaga sp. TaxID=1904254 RepID=UPI00262392AD|nr:DUF4148 domain-containing protein [Hydrogenophaga sp.]MDM7948939.1 DUF4148 domain-containing protein [Hydrogenophaga sp.]
MSRFSSSMRPSGGRCGTTQHRKTLFKGTTMKTFAIAALLAASSFAASAQSAIGDLPFQNDVKLESNKSRAEVIAELRQAQAQDLISYGDVHKPALQSSTSKLTRAEVEMQVSDLASMGKLYRNSNATQVYLN